MAVNYIQKAAVVSPCERYRYLLLRRWAAGGKSALYIMLNPSTADALVDDPTIRSCVRLAFDNGYNAIEVVNLFAFRATDPNDLLHREPSEIFGPENRQHIEAAMGRSAVLIAAWGSHKSTLLGATEITLLADARNYTFHCFGVTRNGAPRHPLYIKGGTLLVPFKGTST